MLANEEFNGGYSVKSNMNSSVVGSMNNHKKFFWDNPHAYSNKRYKASNNRLKFDSVLERSVASLAKAGNGVNSKGRRNRSQHRAKFSRLSKSFSKASNSSINSSFTKDRYSKRLNNSFSISSSKNKDPNSFRTSSIYRTAINGKY